MRTIASLRFALLALAAVVAITMPLPGSGYAQDSIADELRRLEARAKGGGWSSDLGNAFHDVAVRLRNAGQNDRAELPARRALEIWEKVHGQRASVVGNASNTLAAILDQLRKDAEAEHFARSALRIWESAHGIDSGQAANALNTLVGIMRTRGRWEDAEEPARRVLHIWTRTNGPDSDAVGNASNTLSDVLQRNRKFPEAEQHARNALRIWQKVHGADSGAVDNARNSLAGALDGQGKREEALAEQRRVLDAWTRRFGPRSGEVGLGSNNLAWKLLGAGQWDEAETLFNVTLGIWYEADKRSAKPSTNIPLSGLARTAMLKRDWGGAHARVKQAVEISIERTRIASAESSRTRASAAPSEIAQASGNLQLLVKAARQLAEAAPSRQDELLRESYAYAQWRMSSQAAAALAAMASRVSVNPALAGVVRQRQDLEARWQSVDSGLEALRNRAASQRDKKSEQALIEEARSIETRLAALDKRMGKDFSSYTALTRVEPLSVAETQALLKPNEALVLVLATGSEPPLDEETFVWVITQREARWARTSMGAAALSREVAALRCGLDLSAWRSKDSQCAVLTGASYTQTDQTDGVPLPFDAARAHRLYKALFGEVESLIKGQHLLVVPSGALTTLPFQTLVTTPPAPNAPVDQRKTAWLVHDHAITVLPAVASLTALRRGAKPSAAKKAMIGFANPLLEGNQQHPVYADYYKEQAEVARSQKGCAPSPRQRTARLRTVTGEALSITHTSGHVDLAHLRRQSPLPETADEVCEVARSVGADLSEMRIGARASEQELKRMSERGDLAQFRVVHFATHGMLAGQISGTREPGLVLTPPAKSSPTDDGYLSASEIASLKLDADWVILSACNTAGGSARGEAAEALSGLARAFFYAQARALLVSHWAVDSDPTVKLVTGILRRMSADNRVGRAEALRQSMIAMIREGSEVEARPASWAPFVVVGEGAPAR